MKGLNINKKLEFSPSVTIGIPVLNEENHIERVINNFLSTKYSNLIEVIIADGGSEDSTLEIVSNISNRDSRVKLINNPEKFQSFGLNYMIKASKGEIFLRADGHCYYAEDYVEKCVELLITTGAKNVGGAQNYVANNRVQSGIALAVKSFLGNGGAKYMRKDFEGYADTVFLGCFWTKDLKEIGYYNTHNITGEDAELNLRLRKKYGKSIFISNKIITEYYPRRTFKQLFKQYFRYGRGRFLTSIRHSISRQIRGVFPFLFISFLIIWTILDFIIQRDLFSRELFLSLIIIALLESIRIAINENNHFKKKIWKSKKIRMPGILSNFTYVFVSILIMHFGHFSGFLHQMIKYVINRKQTW